MGDLERERIRENVKANQGQMPFYCRSTLDTTAFKSSMYNHKINIYTFHIPGTTAEGILDLWVQYECLSCIFAWKSAALPKSPENNTHTHTQIRGSITSITHLHSYRTLLYFHL